MDILKHVISVLFITLASHLGFGQSSVSQTKVMTYNLRYNNPRDGENAWEERKNDVVALIRHYQPEFLGIQEGLLDQMSYLDQSLPRYSYVGVGRDDGQTKGEFAGIFYRHDLWNLYRSQTLWLSETPNQVSVGWDASMERIVTYAAFIRKESNDTLHVFNAHFDHIGSLAQRNSAEMLIRLIHDMQLTNRQVIVMGDFNSLPNSEGIQLLRQELNDSRNAAETYGPVGTFNAFEPCEPVTKCIDYIFTKNLRQLRQEHIDDRRQNGLWVSDHLPVLLTFVLN